MSISYKTIQQLKKATRGKSGNELWHQIHLGRLTASNHHDIFTNMNSLVKSNGPVKPKAAPLPAKTIGPKSKTQTTTWGIQNEQTALKISYSQELSKGKELKLQNCGIFLHKN